MKKPGVIISGLWTPPSSFQLKNPKFPVWSATKSMLSLFNIHKVVLYEFIPQSRTAVRYQRGNAEVQQTRTVTVTCAVAP